MLLLQELAPREGSVYFKMGRMHRRLNQLDEAVTVCNSRRKLSAQYHVTCQRVACSALLYWRDAFSKT